MKRNKIFIIGLILMIIPFVLGLIFYRQMPDQMAVHFDSMNQPNSYASKEFALFGLPLIMILIYIVAYFVTNKDPKKANQDDKTLSIILLLIPVLTILSTSLTITYSLGYRPDIGTWISIAISILFIMIGNYMPKIKRNYTLGIKVPWTLDSDYIWEKTHRLAGYSWIIGGILLIIGRLFFRQFEFLSLIIIILLVFIPIIYSYILYSRGGYDEEK